MNNKLNNNFSLRKLLLTALVAGPLATLPAPLWALPVVTSANLTVSSPTTITVTAPSTTNIQVTATTDKGVLTWGEFGNGASPFINGETIQYFLPSASSSILNLVSPTGTQSTAASTINGTISSNGNVYVLNPNGIIFGATAQVNTGGFYASTINEPLAAASFGLNGTLSFNGTSTAAITLSPGVVAGAVSVPTFQSVGTGNNVSLYARNIDVNAATVFGNLSLNAVGGTAGTGDVRLAGASNSTPGAVNVNKIAGLGGNLTINSSGANVILSGYGASGSITLGTVTAAGAANNDITIAVGAGGAGYPALTNIPVIFRAAPSNSISATGYATTDANGAIATVVVVTGGSGYTTAPSVTFPVPGAAFLTPVTAPVSPFAGVTSTLAGSGNTTVASLGASGISFAGAPGAYPVSSTTNAASVTGAPSGGTSAATTFTTNAAGQVTAITTVPTIAGSGYVVPPNVSFANPTFNVGVAGNLTVNTVNATTTLAGSVSQQNSGSLVTAAGTTTITTANASTLAPGTISLSNVDFATLAIPSAGKTVITDAVGGLILGNTNITSTAAGDNLVINVGATNSNNNITMASGAKAQVIATTASGANLPTINLQGTSVTFTGTGVLAFSGLTTSTSSGAATVTGDNNIWLGGGATPGSAASASKSLVLTTTGGTISMGALSTTSAAATLTATSDITFGAGLAVTGFAANTSGAVSLKSSAGKVTVIGDLTAAAASTITAVGDINVNSLGVAGGVTVTSSTGSITATGIVSGSGTFTAANNLSIATNALASTASIDRGTLNVPTSGSTNAVLSTTAATYGPTSGSLTGIGVTNGGGGYNPNTVIPLTLSGNGTAVANTNASGQISSINVINPGSGYTSGTTTTKPVPTNAIVASGALTLTATTGTVSIGGPLNSSSTSAVSITAGQNVALPAVTAPTLSVKSTGGNITQAVGTVIVSSGTATLDAATDVTLSNVGNNFGTVVLVNGGGGSTGFALNDINDIVVGNGTNAKGNVAITSGSEVLTAPAFTAQGALLSGLLGSGPASAILGTGPNALPSLKPSVNGASGLVTAVTVVSGGSGYAANVTAPGTLPVAATTGFTVPPPAPATATTLEINTPVTPNNNGYNMVNGSILGVSVVALQQLGNAYTPNSTVALVITDSNVVPTTPATGFATVNGNGQITSVTMTNVGAGYQSPHINFAAPPVAVATETGYLVTNGSGVVSAVGINGVGAGYYGSYVPVILPGGFAAPNGVAAAITGYTVTAGAITSLTLSAGSQYATAPTLNFTTGTGAATTGGLLASTSLVNGAVQTPVLPVYSGGVTLGSAATDAIRVAGNLTLTTTSPAGVVGGPSAAWSQFNTVANSLFVGGNVTLNTSGTNANIGLNPIGGTGNFSFGAINATMGAGSLSVIENTTVNLGTITAANVTASSLGGDIVNSGALTVTGAGIVTVAANSVFSPGNVTLNNAGNNIANVTIQNANNFTLVDAPAGVAVNVIAGNATPGKALAGAAIVSVTNGKNAILTAAAAGSYNSVGFNMQGGNVTVTNPGNITIANASNTGSGTVAVTANGGAISLGSGIALNSTAGATFTSTGTSANITDTAPNISIFGPAAFVSDLGISITKSGHSIGPVSLTSGATAGAAVATSATDITYTEAGTANLNVVRVNQGGVGVNGNLTVVSTSGGILQTPITTGTAAFISVPYVSATGTNTVSFTAASGSGVNLTNPNGATLATNNAIAAPVSIRGTADSSITQAGTIRLGNVAVTLGAFTADASSTTLGALGYGISQATGSTIFAYGNSIFKTNGGAVAISNTGNNFGGLTLTTNNGVAPVAATSAAAPTFPGGVLTVGTYAVPIGTAGLGYAVSSTTVPVTVGGTAGTGAVATATTDAFGRVVSIQLTNGGTGYTSVGSFTIPAATVTSAQGAAVSIAESGTTNLVAVNTGTTGALTVNTGAGLIQTGTLGVTAGGAVSLTSGSAGMTLNSSANNFNSANTGVGNPIQIVSPGNVTLTDSNANTALASGTNIGGTLTLRNTNVAGTIRDTAAGGLIVTGNVLFDVGAGAIAVVGSGNSFGAVQFRGGNVSIAENTTFNLNAGSVASGQVSLSTLGNFITSGLGTSTFAGTSPSLTIAAGGTITVSNPLFVANGLTFRALGAVDLSALSLIGNLNGIAPTNLGSGTYKAPAP